MKWLFSSIFVLLLGNCTSTQMSFSDLIDMDLDDHQDRVLDEVKNGRLKYSFDGKGYESPWTICKASALKHFFILLMAEVPKSGSPVALCSSGVVQGFMSSGYAVAAIHLPGYGGATGVRDLGGGQSLVAIRTFVAALKEKYKGSNNIKGMWGYGDSTIALFAYNKRFPEVPVILSGGGVYDMDIALKGASNKALISALNNLVSLEGEEALEARSIAWDPSGLAAQIVLYHSENDLLFDKSAASAFRDTLATQGYRVNLSVIPDVGHVLDLNLHGSILKKLLIEHVGVISTKANE